MKRGDRRTKDQLIDENETLRARLDEAEQTLEAIRSGDVDALVVKGPQGERVFSLSGEEHIYRVIAETMHEAALTVDPEGTILFCNQRFCDLMKTPMNEALGRKVKIFVSRPQEQPLEELLSDVRKGPIQRRLTLRASDGKAVPVQLSASTIQDESSTGICLLASDLTELEASAKSIRVLRENQQALEESEHRFRAIFESTHDAILIANNEGTCVQANPAAQSIFGLPPVEIMGRHISSFLCRDSESQSPWDAFLSSGAFHGDMTITHSDGRLRQIDCNAVANILEDRHLFVIREITDRKQAEEEVRQSREWLRVTLQSIGDAVLATDSAGRLIFMNPVGSALTGWKPEEAIGKPIQSVFRIINEITRQEARDILCLVLNEGKTVELANHTALLSRDGREIPIEDSAAPIKDSSGNVIGVVIVFYDVTEKRRAEEELWKSRADLEIRVKERTAEIERKNRELQEFVFVASHDLSEPLRKIQTFGSLLKEKSAREYGDREADYISRMAETARRMQDLLSALLGYSRMDTKSQELRPTSLADVLQEALGDLGTPIQEIGAHVEIGPLPKVIGDPYQLRHLFQNLIANSLKYRRPEVKPCIKIFCEQADNRCQIFVEDNGIGFEEKYLPKIFQPFQRLHGRNEYSGVGMGLAICRKIVERHNGMLSAKSTPGKGSTFIVTLPVKGGKK